MLEAALVRSLETLRSAGVTSPPASPERMLAVAAVGEAFARALGRARITTDDESAPPPSRSEPVERERLERSLVDVAVRLLRVTWHLTRCALWKTWGKHRDEPSSPFPFVKLGVPCGAHERQPGRASRRRPDVSRRRVEQRRRAPASRRDRRRSTAFAHGSRASGFAAHTLARRAFARARSRGRAGARAKLETRSREMLGSLITRIDAAISGNRGTAGNARSRRAPSNCQRSSPAASRNGAAKKKSVELESDADESRVLGAEIAVRGCVQADGEVVGAVKVEASSAEECARAESKRSPSRVRKHRARARVGSPRSRARARSALRRSVRPRTRRSKPPRTARPRSRYFARDQARGQG